MGVWSTPRPGLFTPGKETRYLLCRMLGGPQGRSGRMRKISPPTGIRSPDRPDRSESVYRLRYPGPFLDFRKILTSDLMKIRPVEGELFRADGGKGYIRVVCERERGRRCLSWSVVWETQALTRIQFRELRRHHAALRYQSEEMPQLWRFV